MPPKSSPESGPRSSDADLKPPQSPPRDLKSALVPQKPCLSIQKSSHGWDDAPDGADSFAAYMHHKNRKLRDQFNAQFRSSTPVPSASKSSASPSPAPPSNPTLFANVIIWVDGHTNPSRLALRRLMGLHGGRLETYFSRIVTHVVASNLATATRLRLRQKTAKHPAPHLVTPNWVTASIKAAKTLPERSFPIPHTTDARQKSLTPFFASKKARRK